MIDFFLAVPVPPFLNPPIAYQGKPPFLNSSNFIRTTEPYYIIHDIRYMIHDIPKSIRHIILGGQIRQILLPTTELGLAVRKSITFYPRMLEYVGIFFGLS